MKQRIITALVLLPVVVAAVLWLPPNWFLALFSAHMDLGWMTPARLAAYKQEWSRPGRLNAMINWYRASPLVVPKPGEPVPEAPLASAPPEKFVVPMPHLLIWGAADQALRPPSHDGLEAFAPHLHRVEIAGADHWLIHTHAERIAEEIDRFARGDAA